MINHRDQALYYRVIKLDTQLTTGKGLKCNKTPLQLNEI